MNRDTQKGATTVEFAVVGILLFMLLLFLMQLAQYWNNREMMSLAAVEGSRLFSAQRGYATPWTATRNRVRSRLDGVVASAAVLNSALTITMDVAVPCTGACSCTGGATERNGSCVTTCANDSSCQAALGTSDSTPAPGTAATVTLTYTFTPLFRYYAPLSNITRMTGTSSDVVQ
jgi:Flp pilus assembly protein TadG